MRGNEGTTQTEVGQEWHRRDSALSPGSGAGHWSASIKLRAAEWTNGQRADQQQLPHNQFVEDGVPTRSRRPHHHTHPQSSPHCLHFVQPSVSGN